MRGQDLLTALADELRGLGPELTAAYDSGHSDDAYVTSVERLSEAAGYMGLTGVQRIAGCVLANLAHVPREQDERVLMRAFFADWPRMLETHLRAATESEPIDALLAHFGGDWVPQPLDREALEALMGELQAASGIGAALDETEQA